MNSVTPVVTQNVGDYLPPILGETPAVIVGAGIGGLTAALMLGRKGISCTILESRTRFEEAGVGIQLSPNASHLLINIGLEPALRRFVVAPSKVEIRTLTGDFLAQMALGDYAEEQYEAPYWLIHRADLHQVLLDAVRALPNVRIFAGKTVTHIRELPDSVVVSTQSASGVAEDVITPLLVGADGYRSTVRASIGALKAPRFAGVEAWRATLPFELAPAFAQKMQTGVWLGAGVHVVHYPIAAGRQINVVVCLSSARERASSASARERASSASARERGTSSVDKPVDWNFEGSVDYLAQRMRAACPSIRQLLALPDAWRVWSLYDHQTDRMVSNRIALLGDAAHTVLPFLAQGGALAVEDAACLAEVVATEPDDLKRSLKAYERIRLKRAQRVQKAARKNGKIYHASAPFSWGRDFYLRHQKPQDMARRYAWLHGWRLSIE
jgi:salicylate hydroxylase